MSEPANNNTVLIADDDVEILALVSQQLRQRDLTVVEASDGEEAFRLAQEHNPILIVLDVMMPGMSGWEVCRAIRRDENLAATPVLMLTGVGERLNDLTSPMFGATDYLDKPFDFEEFNKRVSDLLPEI